MKTNDIVGGMEKTYQKEYLSHFSMLDKTQPIQARKTNKVPVEFSKETLQGISRH